MDFVRSFVSGFILFYPFFVSPSFVLYVELYDAMFFPSCKTDIEIKPTDGTTHRHVEIRVSDMDVHPSIHLILGLNKFPQFRRNLSELEDF